jgi:hypothetical protein
MKPENIASAQKSFLRDIIEQYQIKVTGHFVYMMEPTLNHTIAVKFMIPMKEDVIPKPNQYRFDSYFGFEEAVCARLSLTELEEKKESIYQTMREYCLKDGYDICSPIYFVSGNNQENPYYSLYAQIAPEKLVIINKEV